MLKKIASLMMVTCLLTAEIPYSLDGLLKYQQPHKGFHCNSFEKAMASGRNPTPPEFSEDKDVLQAQKNFDRFCLDIKNRSEERSIPHTIHLIWLGSTLPEKVSQCFDSWKRHHPGWEIKLWSDRDMAQFEWSCEHSRECFEQADTWAEKADVLRLEVLYKFGGIYSDADVICLNSFDELTTHDIGFFSCFELNYIGKHYGEPFFVGSAVMGARKESRVMKYCLEHLRSKKEAPEEGIIKRTGPGLISRACQAAFSNCSENVLILPCSYFYPLPWKKRHTTAEEVLDFIHPDSLAIHLWDGSWCTHKKKS